MALKRGGPISSRIPKKLPSAIPDADIKLAIATDATPPITNRKVAMRGK